MSRIPVQREKPQIQVGAIGPRGHGKSTLTAALSSVLIDRGTGTVFPGAAPQARGPLGPGREIVHSEYETATRNYSHVDWPAHSDYAVSVITGKIAMDGAILVLSASEVTPVQIDEELRLVRAIGIDHVVVFINKCDEVDDPAHVDRLEMVLRAKFVAIGFEGRDTPIVRGSAKEALEDDRDELGASAIRLLAATLDLYVPVPAALAARPFEMAIEDVFLRDGKAAIVAGRIAQGVVNAGDELEIVGLGTTKKVSVAGIEVFRRVLSIGRPGDSVGVMLRGIQREGAKVGQVLCRPGSMAAHTSFVAEVYLWSKEEGGRHTPVFDNYRPQFRFHGSDVMGAVRLADGLEMMMPGDRREISVTLVTPVAMRLGQRFAIHEGPRIVGFGIVSEILKSEPLGESPDYVERASEALSRPSGSTPTALVGWLLHGGRKLVDEFIDADWRDQPSTNTVCAQLWRTLQSVVPVQGRYTFDDLLRMAGTADEKLVARASLYFANPRVRVFELCLMCQFEGRLLQLSPEDVELFARGLSVLHPITQQLMSDSEILVQFAPGARFPGVSTP